jgi:hypothetical protein
VNSHTTSEPDDLEVSLYDYHRIKPILDSEFGVLLHSCHDNWCDKPKSAGPCNCNMPKRMARARELLSDEPQLPGGAP